MTTTTSTRSNYRLSYPAVSGEVVTQGHVDFCATSGHATHTVAGVDQERCPRCGESTAVDVEKFDHPTEEDHYCVCDHCRNAGTCFGCTSGHCP